MNLLTIYSYTSVARKPTFSRESATYEAQCSGYTWNRRRVNLFIKFQDSEAKMIRTLLISTGVALAAASASLAQPLPGADTHATPLAEKMTAAFIEKAQQGDEFERKEGRLADHRAHDPRVRAFAREMVIDHTRTTHDLRDAVKRSGIAPPEPPQLANDQAQMLTSLKAANAAQFDRMYIEQQIQAHNAAAGLIEGYVEGGQPGPIRDAAAKAAPLVRRHLAMATALMAKLGR